MDIKQQLEAILDNLNALNGRKKIGLALALVFITAGVIVLATYFNKPATRSLYSKLSRQDINSMSRVLSENGINFVLTQDNSTIEVAAGMITKARITLAEYGLPSSAESGYELFDKVNTLGLTSFMQDVTNKRAIQGELARTIQMVAGVNSARVHLAIPPKKIFRRNGSGSTTASLVLKTFGRLPTKSILAIRHMVAAAVPGLETGNVTIIGADGTLLTSKGDEATGGFSRLVEMENQFEQEARSKIITALGAHLGSTNFRITVSAKLNSDQRRINETIYDPESRVERSVQTVKETGTTENKASSQATTITQNLPDESNTPGTGQSSLENKQRREETTNYEINMKKIELVSDGYQIEKLSVALVVNKKRITELLGDNPEQKVVDAKIKELEDIVRSTISFLESRGDQIKVSVVEFLPDEIIGAEPASSTFMILLNRHLGSILNAVGLILGALVLAFLGIRPLIAFLQRESRAASAENPLLLPPDTRTNEALSLDNQGKASTDGQSGSTEASPVTVSDAILDEINIQESMIKQKLENMVAHSEERAAMTVRRWLQDDTSEQSKSYG